MFEKSSADSAKTEPKTKQWPRVAIVVALLVLVGAVLALKSQTGKNPHQAEAAATVAALSAASLGAPIAGEPPEAQLDRLLAEGKPVLAFIHSDNCQECVTMIEVVGDVYPGFADSVALLDLDVYDQRNFPLLRRLDVQTIPTQVFFDRAGERQIVLGAMKPKQLETWLQTLAAGQ